MNFAYVAGLIDADGSIGFTSSRGSYITPRVILTNTNRALLEDMRAQFGGNIQTLTKRRANWKIGYYWQVANSSAVAFVTAVEPYLRVKREQCWLLWGWDAIRPGKGRRRTSEHLEALDLLNAESKWLNQKGSEARLEESPMDREYAIAYSVKRKAKK